MTIVEIAQRQIVAQRHDNARVLEALTNWMRFGSGNQDDTTSKIAHLKKMSAGLDTVIAMFSPAP